MRFWCGCGAEGPGSGTADHAAGLGVAIDGPAPQHGPLDDAAQGAQVIRSLQWYVGVAQDGLIGPATIRALQAKFGQTQDGFLDGPSPTIRALQSHISGRGVLT